MNDCFRANTYVCRLHRELSAQIISSAVALAAQKTAAGTFARR